MVEKILHRKLKIEQHEPKIQKGTHDIRKDNQSSPCSTNGTRRVTVKRHEHHLTW